LEKKSQSAVNKFPTLLRNHGFAQAAGRARGNERPLHGARLNGKAAQAAGTARAFAPFGVVPRLEPLP